MLTSSQVRSGGPSHLSSQGGQCASGSWSFFLTWLWNWEIWRIILNQSMQKLSVHVICVNVKLPHREFWRLIMNQSMKMSSIVYILTTPGKTAPTFTFISISLTVLSCLEENVNKPGLVSQPTKLIILSLYSMPKIIQNTRISEGFTLNQFMRNSSILVIFVNIKLCKWEI